MDIRYCEELIGFARKIFKYRKIGDLAQPPCGVARLSVPAASGKSVEIAVTAKTAGCGFNGRLRLKRPFMAKITDTG